MTRNKQWPSDPPPSMCKVVIDTREQQPWNLSPLTCTDGTLATGDVALAGEFSSLVCIERKTFADYIGSVTGGRDRFERELHRMLAYPSRAVVVEGAWTDVLAGQWRARATPKVIAASTASFVARGIPVIFAGDRRGAEDFARYMMFSVWRREYRRLRQMAAGFSDTAQGAGS